jgi:hypothetical protein
MRCGPLLIAPRLAPKPSITRSAELVFVRFEHSGNEHPRQPAPTEPIDALPIEIAGKVFIRSHSFSLACVLPPWNNTKMPPYYKQNELAGLLSCVFTLI